MHYINKLVLLVFIASMICVPRVALAAADDTWGDNGVAMELSANARAARWLDFQEALRAIEQEAAAGQRALIEGLGGMHFGDASDDAMQDDQFEREDAGVAERPHDLLSHGNVLLQVTNNHDTRFVRNLLMQWRADISFKNPEEAGPRRESINAEWLARLERAATPFSHHKMALKLMRYCSDKQFNENYLTRWVQAIEQNPIERTIDERVLIEEIRWFWAEQLMGDLRGRMVAVINGEEPAYIERPSQFRALDLWEEFKLTTCQVLKKPKDRTLLMSLALSNVGLCVVELGQAEIADWIFYRSCDASVQEMLIAAGAVSIGNSANRD